MSMVRSAVGWAFQSAVAVVSVPARLLDLLGSAEQIVRRTLAVLDEVEAVVARAQRVTSAAEGLLPDATRVTGDAAGVVAAAGRTARAVDELLAAYQPMARRFIAELSEQEVDAAVRMIDELPKLADHLKFDVLPILATLDRVGPDIHDLLEVANDVRQAILGIPGFDFLRRRGEEKDIEAEPGPTT